jgi:hypothetical protein
MQITISPQGGLRCVYTETIDLAQLGQLSISRGSYVEPDATGHWFADLAPVDGPRLGPFQRRSDALAAESQWLEQHWLSDDAS